MYKNKICALYASEEHLVMILTQYIYGIKDDEENVVTFFEKDLNSIAEKIIKEKTNKEIWERTEIKEFGEKISKNLKNKKIIVCGEKKYIDNVNILLDEIDEEFRVINCYSILKNDKKIYDILKEYNSILTTQGVERIKGTVSFSA